MRLYPHGFGGPGAMTEKSIRAPEGAGGLRR
jgi:hypothetical protein